MPKKTRTFSIHMPAGVSPKQDFTLFFDKDAKVVSVTKNADEKPRYISGSVNGNPTEVHANGMYNRWEIGCFPTQIQPCNTISITVETDEPCQLTISVEWTTDKDHDYIAHDVDVPAEGLHGTESIVLNC